MICEKPTRQNPNGRTGTHAGYSAHYEAGEPACDPCRQAENSRYTPEWNRANWLSRKYGMTVEDYETMLAAQFNACAICGLAQSESTGKFHVDHDHSCCSGTKSCGKCVRGILCSNCNTGIGKFGDDVERMRLAIRYLEGQGEPHPQP